MKTALITGFPGQDACYLADLLLGKGYNVYGLVKRYTSPNWSNIEYLNLFEKGLKTVIGDVTDLCSIMDVMEIAKPDEFYNLAAQSFVGGSWRLPYVTTHVDAIGPLNCLEAIRRIKPNTKFYQAGTSEMFGNSNIDGRQTENTPFEPASPYGIAKLYGYHITKNYRESYDAFACTGILFNHESSIRGIEFVSRKITDGVAKISLGKSDKIVLGNLDAERDWGHAKDYVKAQWLMLQEDKPEDFIIATGIKHSVRDLCKIAFETVGISNWEQYVKSDEEFQRPNELHSLHADSNKAKNILNWEPEYTFEKMISEMVEDDISRHKILNVGGTFKL
jgi:GDPmannose 4,6-dehydratase